MVQGQRQKSALAHEDVKLIIADQPSAKHDPKRVPHDQPPEAQHRLLPRRLRRLQGSGKPLVPGIPPMPNRHRGPGTLRKQPHRLPIYTPNRSHTPRQTPPPALPILSPVLMPLLCLVAYCLC